MYELKIPKPLECGLFLTKEVVDGKWKAGILKAISMNIRRPNEIQRAIPVATKRVLNVQLRELEQHGIITKKIYHELPLKVEYSLTELGASLIPIVDAMMQWGEENRAFLETVITKEASLRPLHDEVKKIRRKVC